jgi:hypothetical protein
MRTVLKARSLHFVSMFVESISYFLPGIAVPLDLALANRIGLALSCVGCRRPTLDKQHDKFTARHFRRAGYAT